MVPWDPPFSSIINFTSDESIKKFCESVLNIDKTKASYFEQRVVQLLTKATYEAVVKDKLMVIVVMVSLLKVCYRLATKLIFKTIFF